MLRLVKLAGMVTLMVGSMAQALWADEIRLLDGSLIKGTIVGIEDQTMAIETIMGVVNVAKSQVLKYRYYHPGEPPENDAFALYRGESFYDYHKVGIGLAVGFTSGVGLSLMISPSPVAVVLSGAPNDNGFSLGLQAQINLAELKYQRAYIYGGGSYYRMGEKKEQAVGMGIGYGFVIGKVVEITVNGGFLKGNYYDPSNIMWQPDVNAMVHFFVN